MRLIDADALMEASKYEFWQDGSAITPIGEYILGKFRQLIRNMPTITPEPKWIPCSERLPEKSGQYYVSGGDKVWVCKFLIIPTFTGGWCNDASNPVVQAWMPLSEPYREDGDNVRSD